MVAGDLQVSVLDQLFKFGAIILFYNPLDKIIGEPRLRPPPPPILVLGPKEFFFSLFRLVEGFKPICDF